MTLLTLNPGEIAYAGFKFPRAFVVTDLSPQLMIEAIDIPFAPGQFAPPGKLGTKQITFSGTLGGSGSVDQNGSLIQNLDGLQRELGRLTATFTQGDQPLQWWYDRYSLAQIQRPKIQFATGGGYHTATVSLDFLCSDPRSYAVTPTTESLQTGVNGAAASGAASNNGSARAYPTITCSFQSACVNPVIQITPAGWGAITLVFPTTFQASEQLVIVCDPRGRTILKNGLVAWSLIQLPLSGGGDPNEIMPYFEPSSSTALLISATSGQFTASFSASDTYNL
jgi:hypothetical protein